MRPVEETCFHVQVNTPPPMAHAQGGSHDMLDYLVPRRSDSSPCKHHTYTVFEAMLRISSVTEHVKCITLVYPVVYPNTNPCLPLSVQSKCITESAIPNNLWISI